MMPQKIFYPWMNDSLGTATKYPREDSLYAFLNGICLRPLYNVFRKKLHISKPSDFARLHVSDLQLVGLTEMEINRLVSRMLDLGLPTGNLLCTNENEPEQMSWYNTPNQLPFGDSHRPKLLRKLFGKKHTFHASAPVSPAHYDYPLASGSRLGSHKPTPGSSSSAMVFIPTQRSRSFVGAESPRTDKQLTSNMTQFACLGVGAENRRDTDRTPLTCLIPEQDIKLHSRIGVGSFGIVRRADWSTPSGEVLPVAVKLLRPEAMVGDFFTSFLDELRAMQCLSHPNLIRLYGVVLSNPIMMVTELAPLGSLLLHLRAQSLCASTVAGGVTGSGAATNNAGGTGTCSVPRALQIDSLWDMGVQIACGMAYLSSRGLVHRDLAARNVLMTSVRKGHFPLVKIGDFGLVRAVTYVERPNRKKSEQQPERTDEELQSDQCPIGTTDAVYMGRVEQRIPFAWSAPECLRDRQFSEASDVWSWGVTCWEIWTGGAAPWPGLDANDLLSVLQSGRRLAWPQQSCPRRLYQFMLACWRTEPGRRPSFSYLAKRLDQIRPFEVVARQNLDEADRLGLEAGDVIVVSDDRPHSFWWRGQNRRTGEIGSFPRGIVQRDTKLSPVDISRPLANSFVHAGHVNRGNIDRCTHSERRRQEISSGDRSCFTPVPCQDTTSSTYTVTASTLYDDEATTSAGCSHQSAAYLDALERLRREQAEGLWSPVNDLDSSSIMEQMGRKHPNSEDGYSVCLSIDQLSINTPHSWNYNHKDPFVLDQYEDEEDERFILDNTPQATVGISSCLPRLRLSEAARYDRVKHASLFYDASDYQSPMLLPAPPGPEDDLPPSTVSAHGRSISTPSCSTEFVSRRSTAHSTVTTSSHTPATTIMSPSFTVPHHIDTRPSRSSYHRRGSHQSDKEVHDPSSQPLIDLYSPTPPKPNSFFDSLQFPVPSAPVYEPHLPYYFPVYRPTHIRMATSPAWPPFQPFDSERPHSVASAPASTSIPVVRSASVGDPFDYSASATPVLDLRTVLPNPPQRDPFELDSASNSQNSTPDRFNTPTSIATTGLSASVSQLDPTSSASRVERQLLVGSAAPTNPFYSELIQHATETASVTNQTKAPNFLPKDSCISTSPKETPSLSSTNSTAADVQLSIEIACICAQVPGVSADEARQALAYLLNPFVSVIPYLIVPPLPSAPLYQSTAPHMTELSANRVQLAVRLVSANRLHQLGLTSWELGCQLLSAFNWSLPSAADWLVDNRSFHR